MYSNVKTLLIFYVLSIQKPCRSNNIVCPCIGTYFVIIYYWDVARGCELENMPNCRGRRVFHPAIFDTYLFLWCIPPLYTDGCELH